MNRHFCGAKKSTCDYSLCEISTRWHQSPSDGVARWHHSEFLRDNFVKQLLQSVCWLEVWCQFTQLCDASCPLPVTVHHKVLLRRLLHALF